MYALTINSFCDYINSIIVQNEHTFSNNISCIVSQSIPEISIEAYIRLIFEYQLVDKENIDGVILYAINILNYIKTKGIYLNKLTSHRIILISLMLASKLNDDICYCNKYWAHVGGVKLKSLNQIELAVLQLLNYNLYIIITPEKSLAICKSIY